MRPLFYSILLAGLAAGSGCNTGKTPKDLSAIAREEIAKAENDFQLMAAEKGIGHAFEFFADSNAVIRRRNDTLIRGRDAIANFYKNPVYKTATLKWTPDLIEASESGDLGYTYGHYTWLSKDSTGKISVSQGVFHTVWKKQKDGSWKYCWD